MKISTVRPAGVYDDPATAASGVIPPLAPGYEREVVAGEGVHRGAGRVLFLHEPSLLDEGELDAVGALSGWQLAQSVLDVEPGDRVVARHTMWPWPRRVGKDVERRGGRLINGAAAYVYADSPISWSYDLGELTPRTWSDFSQLPDDGTQFIVKGAKADKSRWDRMWAPDRASAIRLMIELQKDPRFAGKDIVAREYIPLERLGDGYGGCPPAVEFRVFVLDGEILSRGFYWDAGDCTAGAPPSPEVIPEEFLREAARRVSPHIRFFTLDVARTAAGAWVVIEISDGQRAGLSGNDPHTLYREMARILARP